MAEYKSDKNEKTSKSSSKQTPDNDRLVGPDQASLDPIDLTSKVERYIELRDRILHSQCSSEDEEEFFKLTQNAEVMTSYEERQESYLTHIPKYNHAEKPFYSPPSEGTVFSWTKTPPTSTNAQ
ncbi:uncharacterized protein I206_101964 [Kwoniella pini CBS 10737]|uniref:Uncharacterized protein n=1 Tax=Kwoniella pini CBS 10737 TaxID=1296096 RepID=A0A1B9HV66_9TREE|nr:uncharacterized protein I206_06945 [Kwoniella pini CBS 10737]OCF47167.1 hypothetical protein I206_06945 [Kwoniella pini CBS 10737]